MLKFLLGVVSGIVITLASHYAYDQYWRTHISDLPDEVYLLEIAPLELERHLDGAESLDVTVGFSDADVNYVYDELYDVSLRYQRNGEIRSIVMAFGKADGTWIVPNKSDWIIRDDGARVEHVLEVEGSDTSVIK